jgi:von Willebrand factor type A domain
LSTLLGYPNIILLLDQEFGVLLFDHQFKWSIPLQLVGKDLSIVRQSIQNLRPEGGGTNMYGALRNGLLALLAMDQTVESWIVCLTDGESADNDSAFRPILIAAPDNYHLIVIGVNLSFSRERYFELMCNRYASQEKDHGKGFFVRSEASVSGIADAFEKVKKAIPVSMTFAFDGELSDDDCRHYVDKYMPIGINRADMAKQSFWFRYLYRRVKVFDDNHSFNYNEDHENLGSTLMRVMLSEVERLLQQEQSSNWIEDNYSQLIYDFTNHKKPEFRLLCTAPERIEVEWMQKLSELDLPGFSIPTKALLEQRTTLDRYLGQALGITLTTHDDGRADCLQCIDDHKFILTLDFTIKLLLIHERVECRTPCILEGETGVSKTALTKMYSILRNTVLIEQAKAWKGAVFEDILQYLKHQGFDVPIENNAFQSLQKINFDQHSDCAEIMIELLGRKVDEIPQFMDNSTCSPFAVNIPIAECIDQLNQLVPIKTFFEIKVDSSLSEKDFVNAFIEAQANANKLKGTSALVIVFLDGKCNSFMHSLQYFSGNMLLMQLNYLQQK